MGSTLDSLGSATATRRSVGSGASTGGTRVIVAASIIVAVVVRPVGVGVVVARPRVGVRAWSRSWCKLTSHKSLVLTSRRVVGVSL